MFECCSNILELVSDTVTHSIVTKTRTSTLEHHVLVVVLVKESTVEVKALCTIVLVSEVESEVTFNVPVVMERSKSMTSLHLKVP